MDPWRTKARVELFSLVDIPDSCLMTIVYCNGIGQYRAFYSVGSDWSVQGVRITVRALQVRADKVYRMQLVLNKDKSLGVVSRFSSL